MKSEVKGIAIDERTVELPLNDVELSGDFKLTVVQKESTAVFKSERTICSFWNGFLVDEIPYLYRFFKIQ